MSGTNPLITLNISVASCFCVLRQKCLYLKVLEMLTVCHYQSFGDIFLEAV